MAKAKKKPVRRCGDCGAMPGALHVPGCDVERCPRCGGQAISCNCIYYVCGMDPSTMEEEHPEIYENGPDEQMVQQFDAQWGQHRMPWTGEWPGEVECREYGFWCRWGPKTAERPHGGPWIPCEAGHPDARPDLNELHIRCSWDAEKKKYVLRS